jgi:Tol biopolymer transport system component
MLPTPLRYSFLLLPFALLLVACDDASVAIPEEPFSGPQEEEPAWSPDGTRIAYVRYRSRDAGYPDGLYVLDLESGERRLVWRGFVLSPSWSPDSRRLAFAAGPIMVIDADGSNAEAVTEHRAGFPEWSPDGTRLAYDAIEGSGLSDDSVGVWVQNMETRERHLVLERARDPSWLGDSALVVQVYEWEANPLHRVDLSTGDAGFLVDAGGWDNRYPSVSPDGRWIAWTALFNGRPSEVWVARSDGTRARRVLRESRWPNWAPDSERLVLTRGDLTEEATVLWTVDPDGSDARLVDLTGPVVGLDSVAAP